MDRFKRLRRSPLVAGIAGGLCVALLGLLAISAGWIKADASSSEGATTAFANPPADTAPTPSSQPASSGGGLSVGRIYQQEGNGVAYIEAQQKAAAPSPLSPFGQQGGGTATGSGFLIDGQGHVLTNAHVVENSSDVTVSFGDDGEKLPAKVVGTDPSTDVAVLSVDPGQVDSGPVPLGDSSTAKVGDPVVAIGNPFGLDRTVTSGIVSALQREISAPDGFTISDVIQTDAAINPGNSGGPLINADGQVIGINSQIESAGGKGNVGVGFAVPINTAKTVAEQLIDGGTVKHAFLGITGADIDSTLADALNLDADQGVLIQDVTHDGPAADAGLEAGGSKVAVDGREVTTGGDIITSVDGQPVTGMDDLITVVNRKAPGDEVSLGIVHDGQQKTVSVTLGDRPDSAGG
jgi:S1-C subfamily serine protease